MLIDARIEGVKKESTKTKPSDYLPAVAWACEILVNYNRDVEGLRARFREKPRVRWRTVSVGKLVQLKSKVYLANAWEIRVSRMETGDVQLFRV